LQYNGQLPYYFISTCFEMTQVLLRCFLTVTHQQPDLSKPASQRAPSCITDQHITDSHTTYHMPLATHHVFFFFGMHLTKPHARGLKPHELATSSTYRPGHHYCKSCHACMLHPPADPTPWPDLPGGLGGVTPTASNMQAGRAAETQLREGERIDLYVATTE
jgi:hypothetical protein